MRQGRMGRGGVLYGWHGSVAFNRDMMARYLGSRNVDTAFFLKAACMEGGVRV